MLRIVPTIALLSCPCECFFLLCFSNFYFGSTFSSLRFLSINCPFSHKFFNFFRFLFLLLLHLNTASALKHRQCMWEGWVLHKLSVAAYSVNERQTAKRTINVWERERQRMFFLAKFIFLAKIRWARTLTLSLVRSAHRTTVSQQTEQRKANGSRYVEIDLI